MRMLKRHKIKVLILILIILLAAAVSVRFYFRYQTKPSMVIDLKEDKPHDYPDNPATLSK